MLVSCLYLCQYDIGTGGKFSSTSSSIVHKEKVPKRYTVFLVIYCLVYMIYQDLLLTLIFTVFKKMLF